MLEDLSGKVFGRLTVVSRKNKDNAGSYFWECICACGNTKITRGYSLKRGAVQSCGCIKTERSWEHYRKHSNSIEGAWAYYYNQYLRNAKHRKIPMELSSEESRAIASQDCIYCGEPPEARPVQRGRDSINASGMDRIDNNIGYTVSNTVPCCTWCNQSKKHYSAEYFIAKCKAVANAAIARH